MIRASLTGARIYGFARKWQRDWNAAPLFNLTWNESIAWYIRLSLFGIRVLYMARLFPPCGKCPMRVRKARPLSSNGNVPRRTTRSRNFTGVRGTSLDNDARTSIWIYDITTPTQMTLSLSPFRSISHFYVPTFIIYSFRHFFAAD